MQALASRLMRARRQLAGLAGALLCLWLATLGYHAWERHKETVEGGLHAAELHARQFEDYLTSSLINIELGATNFDFTHTPWVDSQDVDARLADVVRASPRLRSLSVADASGRIVASSSATNLGERVGLGESYPQADASVPVLRVGITQVGRDWSDRSPESAPPVPASADTRLPHFVPVWMPLPGASGTQWLVAALNTDAYTTHATQMLGAQAAHVAWLRYDGLYLWAAPTDMPDALAADARATGQRISQKEFGRLELTLPNGHAVLTAYRASSRYPLAVAVHLDRQAVLQPWYDDVTTDLTVALPVLGLMLLGMWLYNRREAESVQAEVALAHERELAARVFDSSSDAILITTPEALVVSANQAFTTLTGYALEDIMGQNPRLLNSGLQDRTFYAQMWNSLAHNGRWKGHVTNRKKNGELFEASLTINAILDASGQVHHYAGLIEDITQARRAHERLLLAASVFEHAHEAIMVTDPSGVIIEVNDAFTRITGYNRDDVVGQHTRMLGSGRQGKAFYQEMWDTLARTGEWTGEIWNRRQSGEVYAEMLTISAVKAPDGTLLRYVSLFSDISQQKEHELKLERIAHFDALTGLPNRVLLNDRLVQVMAQTRRRGKQLAVVFLDLDGFKAVNDTRGHAVGDQLLVALAVRMSQALREGDTLARLGGDEFVAVMHDLTTHADCMPVLERLRHAAAQPVLIDGEPVQVSASLGVAFYPQEEDIAPDQLMRQADQAMYQAKLSGKNRFHVFDATHDRHLRDHHENLEAVRTALEQQELVLHYQPKVNLRSGEVLGAEALIRWQHPARGLLGPAQFLPAIDNHPLALDVGKWVVRTALQQMANWQSQGLNLPVSVNIDAQLLQQPDVVGWLQAELAQHPDLPAGSLQLEVLETTALDDMAHVSEVMRRCNDFGVGFALDDFGTGYSSLTYLKRLPAQELKIDQSFIRDMLDDADDLAILQGVLGLASAFQRNVMAEGVETAAHGRMLMRLGCERAQGYAIARPMPAENLPGWVRDWQPDASWTEVQTVMAEDLPVLFAAAEHMAWVQAFRAHVAGNTATLPPMDLHHCRLGKWLGSPGTQQRHGTSTLMAQIRTLHEAFHAQADTLLALPATSPWNPSAPRHEHAMAELDRLSTALHHALLALADRSEAMPAE
ncbi:MAG TPA: EAL domain-containing protein [Burkholderiaceae bacterium]|nr:EAL domain-containing protein [Burkholderiaceae bacterium]